MQSYVYDGPRSEIINFCKESVKPDDIALMYETSGLENRVFIRAVEDHIISLIQEHFALKPGSPSPILSERGKWCKMGSSETKEWFPWSVTLRFSNEN